MLRERARLIALCFLVADLALVAIGFLLAYWTRGRAMPDLGLAGPLYPLADYLPLLPLALLIWAVLLLASGRYRSHRTTSLVGEAWSLIKLGVAATLLFTLSIYLFRLDALLLTSRTGSALYVAAVDAPRMIQRPLARGTTVRWRAAAHRDGGLYRLYAAPEGEEMRLVSEQEARVGMTDYAVAVPQA